MSADGTSKTLPGQQYPGAPMNNPYVNSQQAPPPQHNPYQQQGQYPQQGHPPPQGQYPPQNPHVQPSAPYANPADEVSLGPASVEKLMLNSNPEKPSIVTVHNTQTGTNAYLDSLKIHTDIHMATAFVTLKGLVQIPQNGTMDGWALMTPMSEDGTVTGCTIHRNPGGRGPLPEMYFEAVVTDSSAVKSSPEANNPYSEYDPNVSTIPFQAGPNDVIAFTISYFEPLVYTHSTFTYSLAVPLLGSRVAERYIPLLRPGVVLSQIVYITCNLSGDGIIWQPNANSIPLDRVGDVYHNSQWLQSLPGNWEHRDLFISYSIVGQSISGCCLLEDSNENLAVPPGIPSESADMSQTCKGFNPYPDSTNMAIILNPPSKPSEQTGLYARDFVYVVDRSGSMSGGYLQAAKNALCIAIDDLKHATPTFPGDKFCVILFDHEMEILVPMQPANPGSLSSAKTAIHAVQARGTTSMAGPIREAFRILEGSMNALPFIVLITDGCVHDEAEIVKSTTSSYNSLTQRHVRLVPRILTFGIGKYCNTFFLKMMSTIGRGHSSTAINVSGKDGPKLIAWRMERLISMATGPILTNIIVKDRNGVELNAQITPYPVPDLTCGSAVMVSGRVPISQVPDTIIVEGIMWNGSPFSLPVTPQRTYAPIQKVFTRRQLDALVARMWMERQLSNNSEADKLQGQAVQLSTSTGVPCPVTSVVAVPMTPQQHQKYQQDHTAAKTQKDRSKTNALLVGAAVGGVVIGACLVGAIAFGLTDNLLPDVLSGGGFGGGSIPVGDDGCCDCCGDCDCDCDCDGCGDCDCDGCGDLC